MCTFTNFTTITYSIIKIVILQPNFSDSHRKSPKKRHFAKVHLLQLVQ